MPWFRYTVHGESTKRLIAADSLPQALLRLEDRGVPVQRIGLDRVDDAPPLPAAARRLLPYVFDQLAGMLDEGLSPSEGLRRIAKDLKPQPLTRSLRLLADSLDDGESLSQAMAAQGRAYSASVRAVVEAGEESGNLPGALRGAARNEREIGAIAGTMSLPLAYPVLLLIVAAVYATYFTAFIFPKFMQLFLDLGMEKSDFPVATRAVAALAQLFPWLLLLLVVAIGALWLFSTWERRTRQGQFSLGLMWLAVPIYGRLALYTALARVASTLALLLRGGVDMLTALRLSREAAGDQVVSTALRRAEAVYEDGGGLIEGLRQTAALPEEFLFRISIAQTEGNLPVVLDHIATDYMTAADRLARRWLVESGPVIVIMLGLVIGLVGFASFAPLVGVVSNLTQ